MKLIILIFIVIFGHHSRAQNKTEVLILGTMHLSQIEGFEKDALSSLIKKLNLYEFDAIGIESMSTELLNDIASRSGDTYTDLIEYYGKERIEFQKEYQKKLDNNLSEVSKKIDSLIQLKVLTNKDRISLMSYYLAAGDLASTVLQYNYLEKGTLIEEEWIDVKTLDKIKKLSNSPNEIYSLAVKLAEMQNLQKMEYIDNLQDESILYANFPEFITEYMSKQELFKNIPNLPLFKTIDSLQNTSLSNKDLHPLYQFLNSDYYKQADYDAQWNLWLKTDFESKTDLSRYSLWEMRNLQIAANIMRLSAFYPRKKILIIIGASHTSFIEKHLEKCSNISLLKYK
jgi:hypothetical protein